MSLDITLLDGTAVTGTTPLVLIGPNGVGKSRLAAALSLRHGYDRIPALRSLSFDDSVPVWRLPDAKNQVENEINQTKNQTWRTANELNAVLGELKAEDAQSAIAFRNNWESNQGSAKPDVTNLSKLKRLWKMTFPGRELDLSTYEPKVQATLVGRSNQPYAANRMSDGERVALYLIARVLRAKPGIVIIDEPEVHFHALLARSFWDVIETERSDCRFVYVTHDLPFALSRKDARIGIVRSETCVEIVDSTAPIPTDLYESILGAASVSMVAKRIVFTEGKNGPSLDPHIYGAWFRSPETIVVPVGSCGDVERSVRVFSSTSIVTNATAVGIVDRDYSPSGRSTALSAIGVHLLPVNEVEGLLCMRSVVTAVLKHLGKLSECIQIYQAFENEVRQNLSGAFLNKQIIEHAKREADAKLVCLMNPAAPASDRAQTRAKFVTQANLSNAIPDAGALFDSVAAAVDTALSQGADHFLTYLPGKSCFGMLCNQIGISKSAYATLISTALSQPDTGGDPTFEVLRADLVTALSPHLPSRT